MIAKIEGKSGKRWQRIKWLDRIMDSVDTDLRELREIVKDREACHAAVHEVTKSQTWLSDQD